MDPHQPPSGQPEPFRSTSIDDLIVSTANAPLATATEGTPETPETLVGSAGQDKASRRDRARKDGRAMAPVGFVIGLALVLLGGMISFDAIGPSFERDGRITDRDTSRGRRGSVNYTVEGVDDHGGTFKTHVSKDEFDDARRGPVVITRSSITGRVVGIRGSGLDVGGFKLITNFFLLMAVIGVATMAWCLRTMRSAARPEGAEPRRVLSRGVRWWSAAVVVAFAIGVFYERSVANMGGERVARPTAAETPASGSTPVTCTVSINRAMLAVALGDGTVSATDVSLLVGLARSPGCTSDFVERQVCQAIRSAMAAQPRVVLQLGTKCR